MTLWVTIGGIIIYDTQIGGSTTAPAYLIGDAELIGGRRRRLPRIDETRPLPFPHP